MIHQSDLFNKCHIYLGLPWFAGGSAYRQWEATVCHIPFFKAWCLSMFKQLGYDQWTNPYPICPTSPRMEYFPCALKKYQKITQKWVNTPYMEHMGTPFDMNLCRLIPKTLSEGPHLAVLQRKAIRRRFDPQWQPGAQVDRSQSELSFYSDFMWLLK